MNRIRQRARKRLEELQQYSGNDEPIMKRVKVDKNDPLVKRIVERLRKE